MNLVWLAVCCALHSSRASSSNPDSGYTVTIDFVIRYNNIFNISFSHQSYKKFLECLCTDTFTPFVINTNTSNQENVAYMSNIECDVNGNKKETSKQRHCSIYEQTTNKKDFSIHCEISTSNDVPGSLKQVDTQTCSNKCVIITWVSGVSIELIYDTHIKVHHKSNTCGTPTTPLSSTNTETNTTTQFGTGDLNISTAAEQVNDASTLDEQANDAGVMSMPQIVFAVLFALFFLTVSFILGVNRERLLSVCIRQRRIFSEKTTPISQGANPDINDKDNTPTADINNLTNPNLEYTPNFHLQLMKESRRDDFNCQTRGNDVKERNDTEQGVEHGETDLYLDHIYAEPGETLRQASSNIYDDASTERQSVIIALPQRKQILIDSASSQRYFEVELEEDTRDAVQDVSEEGLGGDVSVVDASGDGYEVPREVPSHKPKSVSDAVKKEEYGLNRIYETIPSGEICLNTKFHMLEPVGKSSYFEIEANDEEDEISKHQSIRPTRETDRDLTMQNFGDGYEVPAKHTCYPMKGRELDLRNENNACQDGKVIHNIIRETDLCFDKLCDETVETMRREDVNIYDEASIENLPVIISLPRRNLIIEDGAGKQRYFEVELEDDTNDMVSCGTKDHFSEGDGLVSLSNDGYEVPRNKFTHVCNAETNLEGPLYSVCEVIPDGQVPL